MLIVEDDLRLRASLAQAIRGTADLKMVGEADDLPEGRRLLDALQPEVLLLDIGLPSGSGLELIRHAAKQSPLRRHGDYGFRRGTGGSRLHRSGRDRLSLERQQSNWAWSMTSVPRAMNGLLAVTGIALLVTLIVVLLTRLLLPVAG